MFILIVFSSCCSKKEFLTINKPIAYKLVKQHRIYHKRKKISFWKEEWTKHAKNIDSTHFIYQNFETFYVFTPNKIVKKLELRNYTPESILQYYKNESGSIGTYTNCSIKIGSEKLMLEKKGLDTIVLTDQLQSIDNILIRIRSN
ncbi:hypothetical protein RQM59_01800 [Flavobacteriaceae bacterium S356]|uniref:Uncharacterized protein n=1 Tax=Asprobacillus argus TaxID=3076534 RepID=A0ABU3LCS2_9FLAO|nr:hypothetical protein [Flavobacteriaceae bacterium S356]